MSYLIRLTNSYNRKTIDKTSKENCIEKISTGKRINRAADDSAGLSISESFKAQVRGLSVAERNTQEAISLLQVADGALGNLNDNLIRMKELAVEGANGTFSNEDKEAIDKEFQELKKAIESISSETDFNGIKLLNQDKNIVIQVKDNPYMSYDLNLYKVDINTLGIASSDIITDENSRLAMNTVDEAIKTVVSFRAKLGADYNNLTHSLEGNKYSNLNTYNSLSRIEDLDVAMAAMNTVKNDILVKYNGEIISSIYQNNERVNYILNKWVNN